MINGSSGKSCKENQNPHYMFSKSFFFFRKSCRFLDNMKKSCKVGHATRYNMAPAHSVLDTLG